MNPGYDLKKYAVLYVDDEPQSLKYFPKLFGDSLRCLTAGSVPEARAVLEREGDTIGVVISDQRMPGETGVELLTSLKASRPQVVRILTTAHSDLDSAIEAVNAGAIFRYVVKPWEDRDLRGVLLRAMEFHLIQRERDLLLREKLAALQRIVVMDRVRSFAVLAAGLANRIQNPMLALKTFLENAPARSAPDKEDAHVQWGDLWEMAQHECQRVLELVQSVVRRTIGPDYHFTAGLDLASLLAPAHARASAALGASATLVIDPASPPIVADAAMLSGMFTILIGRILDLGLAGGALAISATAGATVWGAPALRVRIRCGAKEWSGRNLSDLFAVLSPSEPSSGVAGSSSERAAGADLLSAYFCAYHHAGDLTVHASAPVGPGFEILLPLDPAAKGELPLERDWVASIFTYPEM